jgi:membrane associated rhomboid family serine protease
MANINAWTVLTHPPHELIGDENQAGESFFEMIKNLLAPYYKLKSLTTLLICISIIVYITLVIPYPPFLKIPTFALEPLVLLPEHLKHFEFYRVFTAPFVYQDITSIVLGVLLLWCLGSFTEDTLGWKMFSALTGLGGLVGASNSFTMPIFLLGCNFALLIMKWADPSLPILYRKVMLIIYLIAIIIFVILFVNYKREEEYNFYTSALYVPPHLPRATSSLPPSANKTTATTSPTSARSSPPAPSSSCSPSPPFSS